MTNIKKYVMLLSVVFLLFMAACSDAKKDTEQSQAVSKKIEKKIGPSQIEEKQIKDKEAQVTVSDQKSSESIDKPVQKTEALKQDEIPNEQSDEKTVSESSSKDKEFDPSGKLNPFLPFVSDQSAQEAEKADNQKKKREPLTPLEKIDIGQLRLTAITRTPSGNIALVEEANGKGYVLNEGTYIGLNSGKVISVLSDKVIIEEEIENIFGKVSIQERELKLQKPTGE